MSDNWKGNWWAFALRGAVAMMFALVILGGFALEPTAIALSFGVYALIDGLLSVLAALRAPGKAAPWQGMLTEGAVGIGVGLIALALPIAGYSLSARNLAYIVAFWALATGSVKLVTASRLRSIMTGEWLLTFGGGFCTLIGFVIAVFPGASALHLRPLLGGLAVACGAFLLIFGYRVHRWARLNL